jgi:LAO/AO transport system kinase
MPVIPTDREVARLISQIERDDPADQPDWDLPGFPGDAHVIGVTGSPGSGKSTLVDALVREIRGDDLRVAVVAIDPSSHVTGGAVLGDRVRMSSVSADDGTFIRSMGTRGSTTGLARAARDTVRVLEAAGFDIVIVETVGVGQVELDVLTIADTVAVVLVPGLGDSMQMNKAGIMEIGDLFVVNMADRPETQSFLRDLKQALVLGAKRAEMPPIESTVALDGQGVDRLWGTLKDLDARDRTSGRRQECRARQLSAELDREVELRALALLRAELNRMSSLEELRDRVAAGELAPRAAAARWAATLSVQLASH